MTPKEKAITLVDGFRFILIKSNTDAGEEILCTLLAKECALVAVDGILNRMIGSRSYSYNEKLYWREIKQEIEKLNLLVSF